MNRISIALLGVMLAIGGCAATPTLSTELQRELDTPLYCTSDDECELMWERAVFFVKANSGFKIQILSDSVVETYNPTEYSVALAFSITKEPLGQGRYQIWTKAWCANVFGCQPNQVEAMARAKRYIRTGQK